MAARRRRPQQHTPAASAAGIQARRLANLNSLPIRDNFPTAAIGSLCHDLTGNLNSALIGGQINLPTNRLRPRRSNYPSMISGQRVNIALGCLERNGNGFHGPSVGHITLSRTRRGTTNTNIKAIGPAKGGQQHIISRDKRSLARLRINAAIIRHRAANHDDITVSGNDLAIIDNCSNRRSRSTHRATAHELTVGNIARGRDEAAARYDLAGPINNHTIGINKINTARCSQLATDTR